jgi:MFS family permease
MTEQQVANQRKDKLWSVSFVLIIFISFFGSMLSNGLNNGIPVYIESIGGSAAFSGMLTSIFSLAAGFGRFLGGNLSDKYGRKLMIVIGSLLMAGSCAVVAVYTTTLFLVLCRLVQGIGFAMVTTASATAAADILPPSRMGEGIGYHSLGYALSLAIGVSFGIALIGWDGGFALFGGFAVLSFMAFILTLICRFEKWKDGVSSQPSQPDDKRVAQSNTEVVSERQADVDPPSDSQNVFWRLIEKTTLPIALVQLLFSFGTIIFTCFSALYAINYGIVNAGMFFMMMAIAMVLSRIFSGKIFDRFQAPVILVPTMLLAIVACLMMLISHSEIVFSAAGFVYGLSGGLLMPVVASEVIRRAPPARWGAGNATFWLSMDIGMTSGTLFWGFVIDAFGFDFTLILSIIILVLDIVAVLTVLRLTGPKKEISAQ